MVVKVGQLLWYKNRFNGSIESVYVSHVEAYCFWVNYRGKEYSQRYSKIGTVFFFSPELVNNPELAFKHKPSYRAFTESEIREASWHNTNPGSLVFDYSSEERKLVSDICVLCLRYEDETCLGSEEACGEYQPIDWQDDRIDEWEKNAENYFDRKW